MTEASGADTEKSIVPEIPMGGWESLIIFQRHGRYDNRRPNNPGNPTKEEQATMGRLTQEGKQESASRVNERVKAALKQDPNHTDFLILNSPTFWLDDKSLGQRAKETADVIGDQVSQVLLEKGLLDNEHLLNLAMDKTGKKAFKGDRSRPEVGVGEAQMFQIPEFVDFLRTEYQGQGPDFWKAFFLDIHKNRRKASNAEGPEEIADRSNAVINSIARFASRYHKKNPGRKLVTFVVGHGDSLRPYAHNVLGIPHEDIKDDFNDAVVIQIGENGDAKTTINGTNYDVPLAKHGRPISVKSS